MSALLKFELSNYFKKPAVYLLLSGLIILGFLIGFRQLSLSTGPEIHKNSPYAVAHMIGFLSLLGIFISTLLAALTLFKEKDTGFNLLLYATPLTKTSYLWSRFNFVFIISSIALFVTVVGFALGQLADPDHSVYGQFSFYLYFQPVLLLILPNALLCTSIVCSVAWLTQNKLIVYLSGLFLYIIYMILLLYSGSPLMAGGLPQSPDIIALAARIDPFGLSAFYQQTNPWTLQQKNNQAISFSGSLFQNRMMYLALAFVILVLVWKTFRLSVNSKQKKAAASVDVGQETKDRIYKPAKVSVSGFEYQFQSLTSLIRLDLNFIMRGIPFLLTAVLLIFFMGMEFYGTIDQGIRLPEQYASTALMVNRIIYNLPGMLILVVLFYSNELYWRSSSNRINLIEDSTPIGAVVPFSAKWISLSCLILVLLTLVIGSGIVFQFVYQYLEIKWTVYLMLYLLIGAPLMIAAAIILVIQKRVNHRWFGLIAACIVIFLLATSIGKSIGLTHPLLRFVGAYTGKYSDMNGWDAYLPAFFWRLCFGCSVTLLLVILLLKFKLMKETSVRISLILLTSFTLLSGIYIQQQLRRQNVADLLDKQQEYEVMFRKFAELPQPTVTAIKTKVELYPDRNAYHVVGIYTLLNATQKPIDSILLTFDEAITMEQARYISSKEQIAINHKAGFIHLKKPLQPGDQASFQFSFAYNWDGFNGHEAFNAIANNGSFIRLSNYFPRFGYQSGLEIDNLQERRKRHLGSPTPLKTLEAPRASADDFVRLDMTIGVNHGQTAVGVGELIGQWKKGGRNYYRYQIPEPIPFRFGLAAANYHITRRTYKGKSIEVYSDPEHFENVFHLIENAVRTLDYCQKNFSPYPFKTIRFVEVSSFTEGFAGTAYPATIFMTENMIFHTNLKGDKGQDVINELAGHELSHQWWGAGQLVPDDREGSKLLTETLAMYTELMLVKHSIGDKRVLDNVAMHRGIYLNEKGFSKETPLYKVRPEDIHLHYSKGLVVMYQLTKLVGEKNVNQALREVLRKHAYPNSRPISTDLIEELYMVSKPATHKQIDHLFKQTGL